MLRYRLRTLLILLALLPPLLWIGWGKYQAWKAEQERQRALREAAQQQRVIIWLPDGKQFVLTKTPGGGLQINPPRPAKAAKSR